MSFSSELWVKGPNDSLILNTFLLQKVEKVDPMFHGDTTLVWKLLTNGMKAVWFAMNTVVTSLRADFNDSNVVDRPAAVRPSSRNTVIRPSAPLADVSPPQGVPYRL